MRLFDIDDVPEVPLLRQPRRSRGEYDARFRNEYPASWSMCPDCLGRGRLLRSPSGEVDTGLPLSDDLVRAARVGAMPRALEELGWSWAICPSCLGMGSEKRKARLLAGFRCERCRHPYLGKGDMKQLGRPDLASNHHWSSCDTYCLHGGPLAFESGVPINGYGDVDAGVLVQRITSDDKVLAEWRILTVHHLDGDKANLAWWNLMVACQRCHLEVQSKVVMERVYPHEHSPWFKPHAAGYYASVYLGEELTREEVMGRLDELLALERIA